jgi:hypothetical protein
MARVFVASVGVNALTQSDLLRSEYMVRRNGFQGFMVDWRKQIQVLPPWNIVQAALELEIEQMT